MKIGIEAQRLFRKKKHGMEVVTLELIRALQKLDKENEYVIFVKDDTDNTCITETPNFKIIKSPRLPYPVWEQAYLPYAARKHQVDVLHCTSNTAPLYAGVPTVLTLHDIIYLESLNFKGSAYQNFGNLYRRLIVPEVVKKARKVITVSEFEKKTIGNFFHDLNGKLEAVYNAANSTFRKYSGEEVENTLASYSLPDSFVLHFGNSAPKKNTKNVLKAYALYREQFGGTLPLVVTDISDSLLNDFVREDKSLASVADKIIRLDYIPFSLIPFLYNKADVFLYPSLRESFGMPILESMACGTPVITSNTSSMPEIAGDCALLIDPYNPEEMGKALKTAETDKELMDTLREKGEKRAAEFNWNITATSVRQLYQLACPKLAPVQHHF